MVNGLSYGLLLFLVSGGLTLIYGLMGVLNFAHATLYMLGAYLAVALLPLLGWPLTLLAAPLLVAAVGAVFERVLLRRLAEDHSAQLLATLGLSWVLSEAIALLWGQGPQTLSVPAAWQGAWHWGAGWALPKWRLLVMGVACALAAALWGLARRTRAGLVVRAALADPDMVRALGHDVGAVRSAVFALGCALAALAGVLGGAALSVDLGMGAQMQVLAFVVVAVGGLGSVSGAWWAALAVGVGQALWLQAGWSLGAVLGARAAQAAQQFVALAPMWPFVLLIGALLWRPAGLLQAPRGRT